MNGLGRRGTKCHLPRLVSCYLRIPTASSTFIPESRSWGAQQVLFWAPGLSADKPGSFSQSSGLSISLRNPVTALQGVGTTTQVAALGIQAALPLPITLSSASGRTKFRRGRPAWRRVSLPLAPQQGAAHCRPPPSVGSELRPQQPEFSISELCG